MPVHLLLQLFACQWWSPTNVPHPAERPGKLEVAIDPETSRPRFDIIHNETTVKTVDRRQRAVEAAKELSSSRRGNVHVRRTDDRIDMCFRDGALQTYRRGRRR